MKVIYNFQDPKFQDRQSIANAAKKYGLLDSLVAIMDSAAYFNALDNDGVPEVKIFNSMGYRVPYAPPESCNAAAFDVLDSLCTFSRFKPDSSETVADEMIKLTGYNPRSDNPEWTVFISWAIFAGRLNKNHVKPWFTSVQNQPCSIRLYLVNMDIPNENFDIAISKK
jgi:hypothetical protein